MAIKDTCRCGAHYDMLGVEVREDKHPRLLMMPRGTTIPLGLLLTGMQCTASGGQSVVSWQRDQKEVRGHILCSMSEADSQNEYSR